MLKKLIKYTVIIIFYKMLNQKIPEKIIEKRGEGTDCLAPWVPNFFLRHQSLNKVD